MAGGPVYPFSSIPSTTSSLLGPGVRVGATNSRQFVGKRVNASISANQVWQMLFAMPPIIPTGTMKLVLLAVSAAVTGNAQTNQSWQKLTPPGNFDTLTLVAEGTTQIAWSANQNDNIKQTKITLDAGTLPAGNDIIVLNNTFETASWTLSSNSVWQAYIIWE
jgi:hypothetical protein